MCSDLLLGLNYLARWKGLLLKTDTDDSIVMGASFLYKSESPDDAGSPVEIEVLVPLVVQSFFSGGIVDSFLENFHD